MKTTLLITMTTLGIIAILAIDIVYQVPAFGLELLCLIVIDFLLIHIRTIE